MDIERHEGRLAGREAPVAFAYRVTHIFRREDGRWEVVLRHADPLVAFEGPDRVLERTRPPPSRLRRASPQHHDPLAGRSDPRSRVR